MRKMRDTFSLTPLMATGALALGLCLSSVTLAQGTQPAGDRDRAPAGAANPGDDMRGGGAGMGGGMGSSDPYHGYQGPQDFPESEVQAAVVGRVEAARGRAEYDLVQTRLHRWIDRSWDDFYNSKDYLDAASAEKRASEQYERERKRVLDRLRDDSSYRAVIDLIAETKEKIERNQPRYGEKLTEQQMQQNVALASLKLGYASTASSMEAAALNADSGVQDARNKLTDIGGRARDLRRTFARSVRRDPQFLASQASLDQAKINRMVSATFFDGALEARHIALRYAWYLHRWDQYRYSVYGDYGYGAYYQQRGYGGYGGGHYSPADYYSGPYMRRY